MDKVKRNIKQFNELTTLNMLKKGDVAVITEIVESNENDELDVKRRLLELGFIPGETVRVIVKSFLLNSPFLIKVGNTSFALRDYETSMIKVKCQ